MEQLSLFDDQIDELIPDRSEVPRWIYVSQILPTA